MTDYLVTNLPGGGLPDGAATSAAQEEIIAQLKQQVRLLTALNVLGQAVDITGALRIAAATTLTTVATLTNNIQEGGYFANQNVMAFLNTNVAEAIRSQIVRS